MPCLQSRALCPSVPVIRVEFLALAVLGLIFAGRCGAQQHPKNASTSIFWIVFESIDTPELSLATFPYVDIFLMDQNGRHTRRLTSDHRSHSPSWSPDGRQIAFLIDERSPKATITADRNYDYFMQYRDFMSIPRALALMDMDGRNSLRVTMAGIAAQDVVWFADGTRIGVRISDRLARRVILDTSGTLAPDSQQSEPLIEYLNTGTPLAGGGYIADYSTLLEWVPPVDNFLPVFVASTAFEHHANLNLVKTVPSIADLNSSLRVMSLDGTLETFPLAAYDIAWSMDGKHIAYSAFSGDKTSNLYVAEMQSEQIEGNRHALTDETLDAHGPAWSADGSRIAFMGLWRDTSQIFAVGADGANLIQVSQNPKISCYHPSWSPDGKWIVADCRPSVTVMSPLMSELGGSSNIYVFDVTKPGSKPHQLTRCGPTNPLPPTCGARNPSFASVSTTIPN